MLYTEKSVVLASYNAQKVPNPSRDLPLTRQRSDESQDFASHFRRHVLVILGARIEVAALDILVAEHRGIDWPTYSDTFAECWWYAWRRGAAYLSTLQIL